MKQSSTFKLSHNPMSGGSLMSLLIVNTLSLFSLDLLTGYSKNADCLNLVKSVCL